MPTAEERARADALCVAQLEAIDDAIMKVANDEWRKVAYVVGTTMQMVDVRVPDVFISERVQSLVAQGKLESQGDLRWMRYSQVRLPSS